MPISVINSLCGTYSIQHDLKKWPVLVEDANACILYFSLVWAYEWMVTDHFHHAIIARNKNHLAPNLRLNSLEVWNLKILLYIQKIQLSPEFYSIAFDYRKILNCSDCNFEIWLLVVVQARFKSKIYKYNVKSENGFLPTESIFWAGTYTYRAYEFISYVYFPYFTLHYCS